MVREYPKLYIKPNKGAQGHGIYKLTRKQSRSEKRTYLRLKSLKKTKTFREIKPLYRYLNKKKRRKMIIQQGITLEKVKGRPYDLRVMVQRKPRGSWTCTGMFSKVGKKGNIVTNFAQGGRIVLLNQLFKKLKLSPSEKDKRRAELSQSAVEISRVLNSKRPGMHEMGIDFAYDHHGHLWLLEVNSSSPQFYPLKKIDRKMYKRMMRFARSYGRRHA